MGSSGQHNLGLGSTRHEGSAWTWVANVVCGQAGQEQMALQRRRSLRCVILGGLRWVGVRLGEGGGRGRGEEGGGARAPEIAEEIHEGCLHLLLLGKEGLAAVPCLPDGNERRGVPERDTPALQ